MIKENRTKLTIAILFSVIISFVFTLIFVILSFFLFNNFPPVNFLSAGVISIFFLPLGFVINHWGKEELSEEKKGTPNNILLRFIKLISFVVGTISLVVFFISLVVDIVMPLLIK